MNNSETSAYQTFRPAPGQADPLATLVAHVTQEVLSHVRLRHTLDGGGGVPQSLVGRACDIVAYRLLGRCNAPVSEARKKANADAMECLAKVARGEMGVEAPVTPPAEATSAPSPSIRRPRREFGPGRENGI
jgi:phage gp36-like protein